MRTSRFKKPQTVATLKHQAVGLKVAGVCRGKDISSNDAIESTMQCGGAGVLIPRRINEFESESVRLKRMCSDALANALAICDWRPGFSDAVFSSTGSRFHA